MLVKIGVLLQRYTFGKAMNLEESNIRDEIRRNCKSINKVSTNSQVDYSFETYAKLENLYKNPFFMNFGVPLLFIALGLAIIVIFFVILVLVPKLSKDLLPLYLFIICTVLIVPILMGVLVIILEASRNIKLSKHYRKLKDEKQKKNGEKI